MLRRTFFKVLGAILAVLSAPTAAAPAQRQRIEGEVLPYVMLHVAGHSPCGKPAALMPEVPPMGATISSSQFRKLDGAPFQMHSRSICGSCGNLFRPTRWGIRGA